jgi:hypothetical protein
MYCPNCGKKVEDSSQNFCIYCGAQLPAFSEDSELRNNNPPGSSVNRSAEYIPRPVYDNYSRIHNSTPQSFNTQSIRSLQRKKGEAGPFSKQCLLFGLIAFLMSIFTMIFGSIAIFLFHSSSLMYLIKIVVMAVLYITGFVFGVISIGIRETVKKVEPINDYENAGITLGILAVIFNVFGAIGVVYRFIIGVLSS